MMYIVKLLWKYFKTIFIFCSVLVLSLMPSSGVPDTQLINIPHFDKVVHFAMYFCLSFTFFLEKKSIKKQIRKTYISALIIISISGIIELLQELWSSGRGADFYDLIANSFGTLSGVLFYFYLRKKVLDLHF